MGRRLKNNTKMRKSSSNSYAIEGHRFQPVLVVAGHEAVDKRYFDADMGLRSSYTPGVDGMVWCKDQVIPTSSICASTSHHRHWQKRRADMLASIQDIVFGGVWEMVVFSRA